MIRRIQQLKSFGVFADFQWTAVLPEFKQFNLFYGWNYSGKTTLSRAFRCFEQKQRHADFPAAQVQLKAGDGTVYDLSVPDGAPVFRVFNSDFVRENLAFDSGSATPILVLGAEDIAKQAALNEKKNVRDVLAQSKVTNAQQKSTIKTTIEKALTSSARDLIKNPLGIPNYDKTRFEPSVAACSTAPDQYMLDDLALAQCLAVYRSSDRKLPLLLKQNTLSPLADIEEKTAAILTRVVSATKPIPRLSENPEVESWVQKGRSLHDGKDNCQFCGQHLPPDLLKELTEHFSADYDDLMTQLAKLLSEIEVLREERIALDHKADFYPELSDEFSNEQNQLASLLTQRNSALEILAKAVATKQTKAFTNLPRPEINDPDTEIDSVIDAINKTIAQHNARTAAFEEKRKEAFAKLESHYAASFVRDQQYTEQLQCIEDLDNTITSKEQQLAELERDIRSLEQELLDAAKGAKGINELLQAYFGKDDLRIDVSYDKRFEIIRGGVRAKNLSEGEKTAIAFAYFVTRLKDGKNVLADMIVIIDDPVSSLDANHLFNTYALIKTQLEGCRQLFVLTHSFEFYNLLREWAADMEGKDHAKRPQIKWKDWSIFLVERTDDGTARIREIPSELLRFKSEYHYLFSTLYDFEREEAKFDRLLSLPNIVRRFMEAFGGIMIPLSTGLNRKMTRLFSDEIERERVWRFINYYSHNTTVTRSLTIPDTSECKAVVGACLKAVRDWDAEYFADLESEISREAKQIGTHA